MRYSEVAARYAKALFLLAKDSGNQEETYSQLQYLAEAIEIDPEIMSFLTSPLVPKENKEKVFKEGLNGKFSGETKSFLLLLAKKGRVQLIPDIVKAFQAIIDSENGVTRGTVRSASPMTEQERRKIEETVSKYTAKRVILTFKEDKSLIGGLVAEVGSYTFDDSLTSHLTRLNEELNRRAQ
jgi:F-type H+-transporting ATPase subunit delta